MEGIEMDCLKPHVGTGTILKSIPDHLPRDQFIFPIQDIIVGPLLVEPLKGVPPKWNIPNYDLLKSQFEVYARMNREELIKTL